MRCWKTLCLKVARMNDIPFSWHWSTIGEVAPYIQRGKSPKYIDQSDLPVINQKCIRWEELQLQHLKYIHPEQFSALDEARFIKSGDVLWNSTGTGTVGRAYHVKEADCTPPKVVDSHVTIVRVAPELDARYLFNWIKGPAVQSKIEEMCDGTTNQIELSKTAIAATAIPIAPRDEQTRIADQLETLLTRIQSCNDRFDAIPSLLKRFRQAVLDVATAGQLSGDWRVGGIEKWDYLRAADVCTKVQSGGTPKEGFTEQGVPFLKVYNIVNQKVAFDYKPQYISQENHARSMSKSQTQPGDVLMNIVGPPLGKVAIVTDAHPTWNINQALTLFRPSNRITTGWLYYVLCGGANIAEIQHETRGSAGQVNISLSQCRDFVFPVPPIAEQTEIVRRVEALFALADRIEARATAARTHSKRLSQLVLAKAFRGELVSQDPLDESAHDLLNRIAAAHSPAPEKRVAEAAARRTSIVKAPGVTTPLNGDEPLEATMKLDLVPDNCLVALVSAAEGMSARELWQKSTLVIDDFYVQLNKEIDQGLLEVDVQDESRILRSARRRRVQP
jgi:type I restriction enzyme S subunit